MTPTPDRKPFVRSLRKPLLVAAPVLVVGAVAFLPVLSAGITNWDDDGYILNNPAIRSLSPSSLVALFTQPHYLGNYHPLTLLSFAVEYAIVGNHPLLYHLDNLILHLCNALLVLLLVFLVTDKPWVALVAALLFAVHPLRVESVAWISERKGLLSAFFFIAALVAYVRYVRTGCDRRLYAGSLVLFVFALLAKGTAVSLALTLILFDLLLRRPLDRRVLYEKLPFFGLSVIFGVMAVHAQALSGSVESLKGFSLANKVTLASEALLFYLGKTLLPVRLSAIYPYSGSGSWLHLAAVLALAALVVLSWRWTRKILFGCGFFFVTILFLLQILGVGKFFAADRYTYLPLIGIFYLAGEGFELLRRRVELKANRTFHAALLAGLAFLVVGCAALTWRRAAVWHDSATLMTDVIAKHPRAADAYINRAMAIAPADPEGAIDDYTESIKYSPFRGVVYNNRGLLYYKRGDHALALADYNRGLLVAPRYSLLYANRGIYYWTQKRDATRARNDYLRALKFGYPAAIALLRALEAESKAEPEPEPEPEAPSGEQPPP